MIGAEVTDPEKLPFMVAHELVHFQQKDSKNLSLLEKSIQEGSADFIDELISGGNSNEVTYRYGDTHERELWTEFESRMNKDDLNDWMYGKILQYIMQPKFRFGITN